jgi:hypothetical protein
VTSTPAQLGTDYVVRDYITLLADITNTQTVFIGNVTNQLFPLTAGVGLTLAKVKASDVYIVATSGTQSLHVIGGGGV